MAELNLSFTESENDGLLEALLGNVKDYCHLGDTTTDFMPSIKKYLSRKYFKGKHPPELEQVAEIAQKHILNTLNFKNLNSQLMKELPDRIFGSGDEEALNNIKSKVKAECIKVIIATIITRRLVKGEEVINSPVPDVFSCFTEFENWFVGLPNRASIEMNEKDEYFRLYRFYHTCKVLYQLYGTGHRYKGVYLSVGALIEGPIDLGKRLYVLGGDMSEYGQRRMSIFEAVTGVVAGKRRQSTEDDNQNGSDHYSEPERTRSRKGDSHEDLVDSAGNCSSSSRSIPNYHSSGHQLGLMIGNFSTNLVTVEEEPQYTFQPSTFHDYDYTIDD